MVVPCLKLGLLNAEKHGSHGRLTWMQLGLHKCNRLRMIRPSYI